MIDGRMIRWGCRRRRGRGDVAKVEEPVRIAPYRPMGVVIRPLAADDAPGTMRVIEA